MFEAYKLSISKSRKVELPKELVKQNGKNDTIIMNYDEQTGVAYLVASETKKGDTLASKCRKALLKVIEPSKYKKEDKGIKLNRCTDVTYERIFHGLFVYEGNLYFKHKHGNSYVAYPVTLGTTFNEESINVQTFRSIREKQLKEEISKSTPEVAKLMSTPQYRNSYVNLTPVMAVNLSVLKTLTPTSK